MKIYFSASLLYKKEKGEIYEEIIKTINNVGGEVVIGFDYLKSSENEVGEMTDDYRAKSYKKFLKWMSSCDQVVIEASFPSTLHIGHEISVALEREKPLTVLYQKGRKPYFLTGLRTEKLSLVEYEDKYDLAKKLERSLKEHADMVDTRFNFYISPEIGRYLDWVAKTKKLPRAVFLRSLLEKAMRGDKGFEK